MQQRILFKRALFALLGVLLFGVGLAIGAASTFVVSLAAVAGGQSMVARHDSVVAQKSCETLREIKRLALTAHEAGRPALEKNVTEIIVWGSIDGLLLCRDKDVISDTDEEIRARR